MCLLIWQQNPDQRATYHLPCYKLQGIRQKTTMGQADQDPTCPAQEVMFWAIPISLLFNRVAGQVEVPAGQVNFRDSLPHSENNVFQSMLHPADHLLFNRGFSLGPFLSSSSPS